MENIDLYIKTLKICNSIDCILDSKLIQIEQNTLYYEKILYQELPKKKISKYQKIGSLKDILSKPEEIKGASKINETIKETLEKAQTAFETIINEKNEPTSKNLNPNLIKPPTKPIPFKNLAKNRKFSLDPRNKAKKSNDNITKPEEKKKVDKVDEVCVKNKEEIKNTEIKSESIKKNNDELFVFKKQNLQEMFSNQKNDFQIYYEIRKAINSNKKEFLENLNYHKEKNIKSQSKFLNKLENHYAEKKKVIKQNFLKKDPDFSLTFHLEEKIYKNVNFQFYSCQNYLKLLKYYIEMSSNKEIKEIVSLNQNPQLFHKKKINEVFFLWRFTNFLEENINEINLKIENFFKNVYSKELSPIRNFFTSVLLIESNEEKRKKLSKFLDEDFIFNYNFNGKNPFNFIIEKKKLPIQNEKDLQSQWKANEITFKNFFKVILRDFFFPEIQEIEQLSKGAKNQDLLREKIRLLRMIFMLCIDKKSFPIFYHKNAIN